MNQAFDPSILLAILAGVAVAASAGLRAFLPLLAIGLMGRVGVLTLDARAGWLSSDVAMIVLGVATVAEIMGDKIPVVDHVLDTGGTVLRPMAASLGAYAMLVDLPSPWAQIVALALGLGTLGVHLVKAKLRLASSAFTLGAANPVLSAGEDVASGSLVLVAIFAPILALLLIVALVLLWQRARRAAILRT
jgi:hypothetical protein